MLSMCVPTYLNASSIARRLTPIAPEATGGRVLSKAPIATLNPMPSDPRTGELENEEEEKEEEEEEEEEKKKKTFERWIGLYRAERRQRSGNEWTNHF